MPPFIRKVIDHISPQLPAVLAQFKTDKNKLYALAMCKIVPVIIAVTMLVYALK